MSVADLREITTIQLLSHLSLILMVSKPPKKEQWVVLERVMNALMRGDVIHQLDLDAITEYQQKCFAKARPLLESKGQVSISADSEEFTAFNHAQMTSGVLALAKAAKPETEDEEKLVLLTLAAQTVQMIHELSSPILKQVITEWFTSAKV